MVDPYGELFEWYCEMADIYKNVLTEEERQRLWDWSMECPDTLLADWPGWGLHLRSRPALPVLPWQTLAAYME